MGGWKNRSQAYLDELQLHSHFLLYAIKESEEENNT